MRTKTPYLPLRPIALLGALSLSACSPLPIHSSFDTLTNETSSRASDYLNYSTFISLSGIVPQHGTQLIFHQPSFYDGQPNSPAYAVGISPTRSFITERKFAMGGNDAVANAKAIRDIRDGLETARLLSVSLVAVKTQQAESARVINDIGTGKASEGQTSLLTALLGDKPTKADGTLDTGAIDQAKALLAAKETELTGKINDALAAAKAKASQNNVVISRWAREKQSAFKAFFSEAFAFSGHGHEVKSGTLVFGDFRVTSLHVGDDIVDMLRATPEGLGGYVDNVGITTFSVKAMHMAYIADLNMEQAVGAKLSLSKAQLANLSSTVQELGVNANVSFGVSMDIGNSAQVSSSATRTDTRCFFPPTLYAGALQREITDSNGYQDLYAVRVLIKTPVIDSASRTKTAFSRIANQCGERDGRLTIQKPECQNKLATWLGTCAAAASTEANDSYARIITESRDNNKKAGILEQLFDDLPYKSAK